MSKGSDEQAMRDDIGDVSNTIIPLNAITAHPRNYNTHPDTQLARLEASDARFGQVRSIVVQAGAPGKYLLVAGHGYTESRRRRGKQFIKADIIPATWTDEQVSGYLVADNMTAQLSIPDDVILAELIQQQQDSGYDLTSLGTSDTEFAAFLEQLADEALAPPDEEDIERPERNQQPGRRTLPLDMIYTLQGADCTCCLAVQAGLKYGIQSASYSLCPYVDKLSGRHTVTFIDNDYFHYDQEKHLAVVTQLRPKYATVRDVMTQAQCAEAGIDYYPLAQILTWAEELATYAENVIIIPKYDCIDQIPAQFMLGYSIPTSHGGTPLPVERFKGRRVHLLGGSWTAQLTYMAAMGEDVVSVDNNMVALLASRYGLFVTPDGENTSLSDIGLGKLNNPRYAALALSFGAIGAKVQELFGVPQHDEFDDLGSDDPSTDISA